MNLTACWVCCGILAFGVFLLFGVRPVAGPSKILGLIFAVAFTVGVLGIPTSLVLVVRTTLRLRAYRRCGEIPAARVLDVAKFEASRLLDTDRSLASSLFAETTAPPDSDRKERFIVVAVAETREGLVEHVPDEWKPWVRRRTATISE